MSRRSVDWDAIRRDYVTGVTNLSELARRHGVPRPSIARKKSEDDRAGQPWASLQRDPSSVGPSNVVDLDAKRSVRGEKPAGVGRHDRRNNDAVEGDDATDGAIEELPLAQEAQVASSLELHEEVAVLSLLLARRTLRRALRGKVPPGMHQSQADVVNATMSAVKAAVAMARDVHGMKPGDPSATDAGDAPTQKRIVMEVAPRPETSVAS